MMGEDDKVFKLVGPVLMSVDLEEARQNVGKRLEFIEGEVKKVEGLLDTATDESNKIGQEIVTMQQEMKKDAAEAARKIADDAAKAAAEA